MKRGITIFTRTKKKNDLLATIFFGFLFGIELPSYRKIHWQHHLHLGTPSDTEVSYFNVLSTSFLLESFTGIHLLKTIRDKSTQNVLSEKMKKNGFKMLIAGALFNLAIIIIFVACHCWMQALEWTVAMLIFFPFFAALRQLLEHRSEAAEKKINYRTVPHGKISRLFQSNLFSRFFGGAGFTLHMVHHWDPQISYTRLKDIAAFLSDSRITKEIMTASKTTYSKTFTKLFSK
jgi:fatty acid desaturase